jgi:hypothetical protein
VAEEEDWFSSFYRQPQDLRVFTSRLPDLEPFLKEYKAERFKEEDLREELGNLKEELLDLREELEKLKDKL